MVNRSDNDCLFDDTSCEGAVGSSVTTTAPGAPGVFEGSSAIRIRCSLILLVPNGNNTSGR